MASPFDLYNVFVNYIFGGIYFATFGILGIMLLISILTRTGFSTTIWMIGIGFIAFMGIINPIWAILALYGTILYFFISVGRFMYGYFN